MAKTTTFSFHRAFYWVLKPFIEIEKLIEIGLTRILTSGQENAAINGIDFLKKFQFAGNGKLIILPEGGINTSSALLFNSAGFKEI